jgi:iron complex outermembrane receptor protein
MRLLLLCALALVAAPLAAQVPADTTRPDSAKVVLPDLIVTVTRSTEPVTKVPAAVGVVDKRDIQGAQSTLGLDEALNNIPGVYVANRYNYSVDQRLTIRGFGARSNFGIRGVKIVLDGIPQTLPDGQGQLTNVDFANLRSIEVLRGSSSSLYGNASGGVVSLQSETAGPGPFSQSVRAEGGSFGLFKIQSRTTARRGPMSAVLSVSRTQVDGFRQNSETEFTQLNLGADYLLSGSTTLGLRFGYSDAPKAQNPGALTQAEVEANRDSAGAANLIKRADKEVSQGQLGVTLKHYNSRGELNATVFGVSRDLENPLATPPRGGAPSDQGLWQSLDRTAGGLRLSADQALTANARFRVTTGLDLQRMRDNRTTYLTILGQRDSITVEQKETITEIGPFAQLHWAATPDLLFSAGGRYDAVKFQVADEHLSDGTDNSGDRTMSAVSGNIGVTYVREPTFRPYANISTSFETPTTTELANQPNSTGGFNEELDPSRATNYEIGARGTVGRFSYSVAGYLGRIRDAIVQYQEVSGRAYFTNAGRLKNDGIELGLTARVLDQLAVFGNYTWSNFRYDRYRVERNNAGTIVVDDYDGNRVPGVPRAFIRLGMRAGPVRGFALDLDHTMASTVIANDANTQYVSGFSSDAGVLRGLGSGVTNARMSWEGTSGGAWIRPFIGVNNLWDREYVGSLTLNATFGRVYEPAPGRNWYIGGEIGWAARPRQQ